MNLRSKTVHEFLLRRVLIVLGVVISGACMIAVISQRALNHAASALQAELLAQSLETSLRYDLLTGNLLMSGDRIRSYTQGALKEKVCVQVLDASGSETVREGASSLCDKPGAREITSLVYFDEERTQPAFKLVVRYDSNILKFTLPAGAWMGALAFTIVVVILLLRVSNQLSNALRSVQSMLSGRESEIAPRFRSLRELVDARSLLSHLKAKDREVMRMKLQEQEVEIKSRVQAQVAHDIQSPLIAFKMLEPALRELKGDNRVLLQSALQRIREIAGTISLQRQKPGKEPRREPWSVGWLAEELMSEKRVQFGDRLGLDFCLDVERGSDGGRVNIDKVEFSRVLSNLMNNAVEAMSEEGTLTVSISVADGRVRVKVQDTGGGISPEILPRLGNYGETYGKLNGSGMGLAHAKATVEQFGGSLSIDSLIGIGTTVTIEIPSLQTGSNAARASSPNLATV